jgi:peptide/nickel transport system substrate-binding protein
MKKIQPIVAVLIIAVLIVASIGAVLMIRSDSDDDDGSGITLVVGTTEEVTNINIGGDLDTFRDYFLTESLVRMNSEGDYVGALAESWNTSDSITWTFDLRTNVTWHDGVALTAADVAFSLEYLPDKLGGSNWAIIDHVTTPDDYTVVITLKYAKATFLVNLIELRTIPQHIFQNITDPESYDDMDATIGCGVYKFVSLDEDAGIMIFEAYEDYYGGTPTVSKIIFHLYANEESMVMALLSDDIDTVWKYSGGISYYYAADLVEDSDIDIMTIQGTGVGNALWFNTEYAPFDNATMRQAISYAINYEELVNLFTGGYGSVPTAGFLTSSNLNYNNDTRTMSYNVTYAEELLDSLGYIDSDADGMRETPTDDEFQPVITMKNDATNIQLGVMLKQYLNAVGIDVQIDNEDGGSFWDDVDGGDYQIFIYRTTAWGMIMASGYGTGYLDAVSEGGNAWTNLNDSEFDELTDELLTTVDAEDIKELAMEVQEFFADELPVFDLYWSEYVQPYNNKYDGYVASPMSGIMCYETFFGLYETE